MALQCYIDKAAEMPTAELIERINLLNQRFGGGDSADANKIANATVQLKINTLTAELERRG